MRFPRLPIADSTLALMAEGYAWLPDLFRNTEGPVARARVFGRHAVALHGPEAVRFFYDEDRIVRHPALPEPILSTIFGHGGVHSLDGEQFHARKGLFLSQLMEPESVQGMVEAVGEAWDEAARSWEGRSRIVLLDEAAEVLTRGACRWAGVPLDDGDAGPLSRDLISMVDGFATLGPRHVRARTARRRREAWLARMVREVREGNVTVLKDSPAHAVIRFRDAEGEPLEPRVAAVEILNIIRPTAAVAWFVAFAAHALHLWPAYRAPLRDGDAAFAEAFTHEVRRFYPFTPFVGGVAARDLTYQGEPIPEGTLVLLDLYGQNHDASLWTRPYTFDPRRFSNGTADPALLVPQGGGPRTGHRCPGEPIVVGLLEDLASRLARLRYDVPPQDLAITLRRVPARPRSGFVITGVRPAEPGEVTASRAAGGMGR
jgi:fatty-acid peroxygenase